MPGLDLRPPDPSRDLPPGCMVDIRGRPWLLTGPETWGDEPPTAPWDRLPEPPRFIGAPAAPWEGLKAPGVVCEGLRLLTVGRGGESDSSYSLIPPGEK